jgi:hypothetical protein
MAPSPPPTILFVVVPKLTFDLVSVVLGSMKLAGFVVLASLGLGLILGVVFVHLEHRRRQRPPLTIEPNPR